uniref:Uncharacterized protein n=1 Tax=Anguilla anguilla TaxID=7936 RepID=A0A0E9WKB8_ANGAN
MNRDNNHRLIVAVHSDIQTFYLTLHYCRERNNH